ncbi:hypothetical protein COOONC_14581, partial [Cooperia oncophora]
MNIIFKTLVICEVFRCLRNTMAAQLSRSNTRDQEIAQTVFEEVSNDQQEEPTAFILIEKLEQSGISSGDIKRLKEAGFNTVERIAHAMRSEITSVKGISEQKADKLLVSDFIFLMYIFSQLL